MQFTVTGGQRQTFVPSFIGKNMFNDVDLNEDDDRVQTEIQNGDDANFEERLAFLGLDKMDENENEQIIEESKHESD